MYVWTSNNLGELVLFVETFFTLKSESHISLHFCD